MMALAWWQRSSCLILFLLVISQFPKETCLISNTANRFDELKAETVDESIQQNESSPVPQASIELDTQLGHHFSSQNVTMKKIGAQGVALKKTVEMLQNHSMKLDIVFLVDASSSVGNQNFQSELKFVKKLLADFSISENETRVAVITFSDQDKVVRHIDHISVPSAEHHKCNMVHEGLPNIEYSGGLTFTLGALLEAQSVLEWSRPGALKSIFLITDGFSNGGDPGPVAQILKENGTFIFTFGIQSGNIIELENISSTPPKEFSYLVDSFDQFEALVRRALHQDLSMGPYQRLTATDYCDTLCSDFEKEGKGCCDTHALCSCGTGSGHYRCLCNPGFYGSGLKNSCHACPNGTYYDGRAPGDESVCLSCPDPNHITVVGTASSKASCTCKLGFVARGDVCEVIMCPLLFPPHHGYFVKGGMCSNVYNAACGMRCKAGYSLRGSSIRLCQENGTWSGNSSQCVVKMCPDPEKPINGNMECSLEHSVSNDLLDSVLEEIKPSIRQYVVDSECHFTCRPGHILTGSRTRHCLPLARWDGLRTICKSVACRPLNKVPNGSVTPVECTDNSKLPFGQKCNFGCQEGYKLIGPALRECGGKGGQWSMKATSSKCIDEQPPLIKCPSNIETTTDPTEPFATVFIPQPTVTDNSGQTPIVWSKPSLTIPMKISIGVLVVVFIAMDPSHNQAMCNMTVTVLDKEPPMIDSCISPKPVHLLETGGNRTVSWIDPEFTDNSRKKPAVTSSHPFGEFPFGKSEVIVVAHDESGNNSSCVIEIIVEESLCSQKPPKLPHGTINCSPEVQGFINCSLTCNEGYAFDENSFHNDTHLTLSTDSSIHYSCSINSTINGRTGHFVALPYCAETFLPNSISQEMEVKFLANQGACDKKELIKEIEESVEVQFSEKIEEICSPNWNYACHILNTSASCEEIASLQEEETNMVHHQKRSLLTLDEHKGGTLTPTHDSHITVHFTVTSHLRNGLGEEKTQTRHLENGFNHLKAISGTSVTLPSNVKGQTQSLQGKPPVLNCSVASVAHRSGLCVNCPPGTHFSNLSQKCLPCPAGFYQSLSGQMKCLQCPEGMSTKYVGSRNIHGCLRLCQPGSYGRVYSSNDEFNNAVSPCSLCNAGSYQPNYGATSCIPCPKRSQFGKRGAKNLKDCLDTVKKDTWLNTNICFAHLCKNGGTCRAISLDFASCSCQHGFYGSLCELEIDFCNSSPCLNGGQCLKKNQTGYICKCAPGFTGETCEVELNECSSNPCLNNGSCEDLQNGFFCDCPDGFQGERCEENIDDCFNNPCGEHGQCVDGVSKYRCICSDGYSGNHCRKEPVDLCFENDPCLNGGSCVSESSTTYRCICLEGWEGKQCDIVRHGCSSSPCLNNGTCVPGDGKEYHCQCPSVFAGDFCQTYVKSDFVLHMQSPSITDYAIVAFPRNNLSEITTCLWLLSEDGLNYGTPFSYANEHHFNSFTLTDYNGFVLYVNGERVVTDVSANDGLWHHVCVIWQRYSGFWGIYLDGSLRDYGFNLSPNNSILGGGKFVLGQEQDSVGGGFSEAESLIGRVYRLDVWDYSMDSTEISKLTNECKQSVDGSLVKWSDFLPSVHGKIKVENSTFCLDCPTPEPLWHGAFTLVKEGSETIASYICDSGFILHRSKITTIKRRCLKQGSWEGSSPVCVRRSCGFPGYLPGGTFRGRSFLYTDEIKYICHMGTQIVGNASRVCQADGSWSGDPPICKGRECPTLIPLKHGKVEWGTKPGGVQSASFSCEEGFYIDGPKLLTCMHDGSWDETVPECIPIMCPPPPQRLQNAHIRNVSIPSFKYMDAVHYECDQGYNMLLSSSSIIFCNKNGLWSNLPNSTALNLLKCELRGCVEPDTLDHGSWGHEHGFVGDTFKYASGSVIEAKCELHFNLHGPKFKFCNESAWWPLDLTQCVKKTCDTDELPYDVPHSILQLSGEEVGDTATLSCEDGYQLHTANPATASFEDDLTGNVVKKDSIEWVCNPDGVWLMKNTPKPVSSNETEWVACLKRERELLSVAAVRCNQPQAPDNGLILPSHAEIKNSVGSIVEVLCRPGFWLDGPPNLVCGTNGYWMGSPLCRPTKCLSLPQFPNMVISSTTAVGVNMVFGDKVTFSCVQGFNAQGDLTVRCQSTGKWSPLRGICIPI